MIGNAVPPAFAYLMGHVHQDHPAGECQPLSEVAKALVRPVHTPAETPPDRAGARYPTTRTFRFAIPSLQLKSGVRFEFRNDHSGADVRWEVAFYFGTSKEILSLVLDHSLARRLTSAMSTGLTDRSEEHTSELQSLVRISYAVFCLKKKTNKITYHDTNI